MKWKNSRNYRRIKDKNGVVIANVITVNGIEVEVSTEVYEVYSTGDRQERYQEEQKGTAEEVSLDSLEEQGFLLDLHLSEHAASAEQAVLDLEEEQELEAQCVRLQDALAALPEEDRALLHALFFEGLSTREYAGQLGVTHWTISKRRNRILQSLKKFF